MAGWRTVTPQVVCDYLEENPSTSKSLCSHFELGRNYMNDMLAKLKAEDKIFILDYERALSQGRAAPIYQKKTSEEQVDCVFEKKGGRANPKEAYRNLTTCMKLWGPVNPAED